MLSIKIMINGIKRYITSKCTIIDAYHLLIAAFDGIRCELMRFLPGDKTIKYGPLGEYMIINWDKKLVTLGDPIGVTTWRFSLDKYNHLVLHRGKLRWSPDYGLSCWRQLENDIKATINERVDKILLEE